MLLILKSTHSLKTSRDGDSKHFPRQPITMPHNLFSKEISPNIHPKPPLEQLEPISPHLITWCLGEEPDPHLTTTSFKVIVKYNKVSPEPSLLQAKQPLEKRRCFWPGVQFLIQQIKLETCSNWCLSVSVSYTCYVRGWEGDKINPSLWR